jgi:predicted dehydrogenase
MRALAAAADIEVVAISALRLERAQARAAEFGIAAAYAGARVMLEAEQLDAVDINTWRDSHAELTLLAADRGIDVLCQKPLAPTTRRRPNWHERWTAGSDSWSTRTVRFAPHFRTIRSWLASGRVGDVRQVVMTSWRSSLLARADGTRPAVERAAYFAREPRLMIGEALIHQLDVLRFLLGPLRVVASGRLIPRLTCPARHWPRSSSRRHPGHRSSLAAASWHQGLGPP